MGCAMRRTRNSPPTTTEGMHQALPCCAGFCCSGAPSVCLECSHLLKSLVTITFHYQHHPTLIHPETPWFSFLPFSYFFIIFCTNFEKSTRRLISLVGVGPSLTRPKTYSGRGNGREDTRAGRYQLRRPRLPWQPCPDNVLCVQSPSLNRASQALVVKVTNTVLSLRPSFVQQFLLEPSVKNPSTSILASY